MGVDGQVRRERIEPGRGAVPDWEELGYTRVFLAKSADSIEK
jgi:hypothetical protein